MIRHAGARFVVRLLVAAAVVLSCAAAQASNDHSVASHVVPSTVVSGLVDPQEVAVSPDGAHVYVLARFGSAVFARDPVTEQLTWLGSSVVTGTRIAMSPDGAHVYTVLVGSVTVADTVRLHVRDTSSGLLTFVEAVDAHTRPPSSGVGPLVLALAPDGTHVYVGGSDGISRFARDAGSGTLTYLGITPGSSSITGVAISGDGSSVYATSGNQLATFARDAVTGDLTPADLEIDGIAGVQGLDRAVAVAVAPDGAHVYAVGVGSSNQEVATFARDDATGALTFVEVDVLGAGPTFFGDDPVCDVAVAPDGAHVYVGSRSRNHLQVFARDAGSGALTSVQELVAGQLDDFRGPGGTAIAVGGGAVYVAGNGDDALVVLMRDAGTGLLTPLELQQEGAGEIGERMVASPDSRHVYTISRTGTVIGFTSDPVDGTLTRIDTEMDGIGGRDGLRGASSAALSPDGRHLYVGCGGDALAGPMPDYGVAIFERDLVTGELTLVGTEDDGLTMGVAQLLVSPDGAQVYVTAGDGDAPGVTLHVFSRDPISGALSAVSQLSSLPPGPLATSPDGRSIYVIGSGVGEKLVVLSRDLGTGAVTVVQTLVVAQGADVAVSPDGRHVYAATGAVFAFPDRRNPTVRTLQRDPTTGLLSETTILKELPLMPGEIFPSVDGRFVYALNQRLDGDGVGFAVLRRDVGSGRLATVASAIDAPFTGFASALVRHDGALVYVKATGGTVHVVRPVAHCAPSPLAGCRTPLASGRSAVIVQDRSDDLRNKVVWKWGNGADTALGDFGAPTSTTAQTVCVYDASAQPQPLLDVRMPAGGTCSGKPCWLPTSSGYRYTDKERTPDGVTRLIETAGTGGRAKITLSAKGATLPFPPAPALPLAPPVRVQLQTDGAGCWEATFSTPVKNDGTQFRASSD